MFERCHQTHQSDEEEKHSTGNQTAHQGQAGDDRGHPAIGCHSNQDERHHLNTTYGKTYSTTYENTYNATYENNTYTSVNMWQVSISSRFIYINIFVVFWEQRWHAILTVSVQNEVPLWRGTFFIRRWRWEHSHCCFRARNDCPDHHDQVMASFTNRAELKKWSWPRLPV